MLYIFLSGFEILGFLGASNFSSSWLPFDRKESIQTYNAKNNISHKNVIKSFSNQMQLDTFAIGFGVKLIIELSIRKLLIRWIATTSLFDWLFFFLRPSFIAWKMCRFWIPLQSLRILVSFSFFLEKICLQSKSFWLV